MGEKQLTLDLGEHPRVDRVLSNQYKTLWDDYKRRRKEYLKNRDEETEK